MRRPAFPVGLALLCTLEACGGTNASGPVVGSTPSPLPTGASTPTASPQIAAGIHPLTQVNATAGTGYFSDPLPIHLDRPPGSSLPSISGTTKEILTCGALASGCYTPSTLTIVTGAALASQLPANTQLKGYQNNNVFQDDAGNWQMATTATVDNPAANPGGLPWNVILHASPASGSALSPGGVPLSWQSDTLLVGSFIAQENANYDGKYLDDTGQLYLIYSKRLQTTPTAQDGIVAQSMVSPEQSTGAAPVTLVAPENNADGGYNSELFTCGNGASSFKLIETGNISVVDGKYAMAYSTGSYEMPCYKVGIAWSDALLGPYKKVLQADPRNVWQNPTPEPEVLYLLQSQLSTWPNYAAATVQAPGVPSLVQYPAGTWYLNFAGYAPSVQSSGGMFNPMLRQPYEMQLTISVPTNTTVAATASTALASWITEYDPDQASWDRAAGCPSRQVRTSPLLFVAEPCGCAQENSGISSVDPHGFYQIAFEVRPRIDRRDPSF